MKPERRRSKKTLEVLGLVDFMIVDSKGNSMLDHAKSSDVIH